MYNKFVNSYLWHYHCNGNIKYESMNALDFVYIFWQHIFIHFHARMILYVKINKLKFGALLCVTQRLGHGTVHMSKK